MNQKINSVFVFFILFHPIIGYSQEFNFFHFPNFDSTYVDVNWDTWSIRTFGILKPQPLVVRLNSGDAKVRYRPTNQITTGLGLAYKFILLDIGFGVPIEKANRTSRFDFQTYLSLNSFELEAFAHTNRGLTLKDDGGKAEAFREDLRTTLFGVNFYHNVKKQVLSRQSINSGTHTQRKTTSNFVIGGYLFYHQLKADSSVVSILDNPDLISESYISQTRLFTPGISFGYGTFFVLPKNFFMFTGIIPGLGLTIGEIESDEQYSPPIGFSGKINVRLSFGYASPKLYSLLSFFSDYSFVQLGNNNFLRYDQGRTKLIFGWRFNKKIKSLEELNKTIQKL